MTLFATLNYISSVKNRNFLGSGFFRIEIEFKVQGQHVEKNTYPCGDLHFGRNQLQQTFLRKRIPGYGTNRRCR